MALWLRCREQAALEYVEGYTNTRLNIPLDFGLLFHECDENEGVVPYEEVCKKFRFKRMKSLNIPSERQQMEWIVGCVKVLYPRYREYWKEDDSQRQWIGREVEFDITHKVVYPTLSHTFRLRGKRDGILRRTKHLKTKPAGLGLFETKTKGMIKEEEIISQLQSDLQTLLYLYSIQHDKGETPNHVLYNVVKRPGLRQGKTETLPQFLDRTAKDIDKRPDDYFARFEVEVKPEDIDRFITTTLNPILFNIYQWWESIRKDPTNSHVREESPYHFDNLNERIGKYGKATTLPILMGQRATHLFRRSSPFRELSN